jgi:hypothetical protein
MPPDKTHKPKKARPPPTPKLPKPWDAPPPPQSGDAAEEITFTAVGRAISAWEGLEAALALVFAGFMASGNSFPAERAYGAVLTFRGRAEMIEAAAQAYFFERPDADLEKELNGCLEAAKGFSPRRNEIAHGVVRELSILGTPIVIPGQIFFRPSISNGFAVLPSQYATNKTKLAPPSGLLFPVNREPKYIYSSAEINAFSILFRQLGDRTGGLAHQILLHAIRPRPAHSK